MEIPTWNILLIDDDEDDYLIAFEMFSQAQGRKIQVCWSAGYEQGRSSLFEEGNGRIFDAVFVDYDLGLHNGLELIREGVLRNYPAPFLLLTGRGSYDVDVEAMQAGASVYLTKSEINPLLLERSIRYAIERKQAELQLAEANNALRNSEERYRRLVSVMPAAMYACDSQGKITFFNQRAVELWGRAPTEDDRFTAAVHIYSLEGVRLVDHSLPMARAIATGRSVRNYEMVIERLDETRITVSLNIEPLYDDKGRRVGTINVFQDISESKQLQETLDASTVKLVEINAQLRSELEERQNIEAQLKVREEALRVSEERFRMLADSMPQLVWSTLPNGLLDYCNRRVSEYQGIKRDNDVVFDWENLVHPADLEHTAAAWHAAVTSGEAYQAEHRLWMVDGAYRWHLSRAVAVRDDLGQISRWYGTSTDIHDRKLAELALARNNAELSHLEWVLARHARKSREDVFEPQPYGNLAGLNNDREILDAVGEDVLRDIVYDFLDLLETSASIYEKNGDYALGIFASGWCRMLDIASRKLADTDDHRAALVSGKWLCHDSCWKNASLRSMQERQAVDVACNGGLHLYAVPVIAGDEVVGSINFGYGEPPHDPRQVQEISKKYQVPVETLQALAETYESRPPYMIELARSRLQVSARLIGALVERRRTEQALVATNAALRDREEQLKTLLSSVKRSNHDLEHFAFVASHDLQEPLRKVMAFGDRLEKSANDHLTEIERDYLRRMRSASERMQGMIDGLLMLSRITTRGQAFETVDLIQVAHEVVQDLEERIRATKGRVELPEGGLPLVKADPLQMRQLLQNLIGNGLKFHRQGVPPVVYLSGAAVQDAAGQAWIELVVEDNGIGFEQADAERIFEPFTRLNATQEYEGSGMGLAICKKIVERHAGTITAIGQVNQGSHFIVRLPM